MLRRQTRERREYIFKKSQESQERAIWERKQRIKELLATGKPIPPELKADVREFGGKDLVLDEAQAGECFAGHEAMLCVGWTSCWSTGDWRRSKWTRWTRCRCHPPSCLLLALLRLHSWRLVPGHRMELRTLTDDD